MVDVFFRLESRNCVFGAMAHNGKSAFALRSSTQCTVLMGEFWQVGATQ